MNKIILASTSPRRKELLEREGVDFIVDASFIDEVMDETLDIETKLTKLATQKALPIHEKYPDDIVIGADTVVYLDGHIIGKAKDERHAREILTSLSNREHEVYTGVAIYIQETLYTFYEKTIVCFKDISNMIDDYIKSGEWIGKAGAYGIQGPADCFVSRVDGDIDSVIGLPVRKVLDVIKNEVLFSDNDSCIG